MSTGEDVDARIERIEAHLEIQQLPIRYALAVDGRDVDAWVNLFVPDVDMGRRGRGREVLKAYIEPQIRQFYRSVHLICGHRIELVDSETGRGAVYCRAEHEVGDRWIVMAICYFDDYRRVNGQWFFERRQERHWYAADLNEAPQAARFDSWGTSPTPPGLPHDFPSWASFWAASSPPGPVTKFP
jgi:hypothetical protein